MVCSRTSSTLLLGAALLSVSFVAQAAEWTAVSIGLLGNRMYPAAINIHGDVVGTYAASPSGLRAFAYRSGRLLDSAILGGGNTGAQDINDAGTVVGYLGANDQFQPAYLDASGAHLFRGVDGYTTAINNQGKILANLRPQGRSAYQVVVYDPATGQSQVIAPQLGTDSEYANDMNDSGAVVGSFDIDWGRGTEAFVWRDGRVTRLHTGDNRWGSAVGINNAGHIIGAGQTNFDPEYQLYFDDGFFYVDDQMAWLPNVAGFGSRPYAINNADMIVGWSEVSWTVQGRTYSSVKHAVLWQGASSVQDINTLVQHPDSSNGAYFEVAQGINDRGQIVATDNRGHAWLLSPPAPESARILERARLAVRAAR